MAFCGPDWLRGARPAEDLHHLMLTDLLEEFDAIRLWLVIIRNSVVQENEVTETIRGRKQLWMILREIDHGWTEVTKLFLAPDRSPSVRNTLIDIQNNVTTSATRNRHSRLLPPPIFANGVLNPPTMPTKPGRIGRLLISVRSRLSSDSRRRRRSVSSKVTQVKTGDLSSSLQESLMARFLHALRNIAKGGKRVAPLNC